MLPVVVSSSTKFSRQAASCRDNISKRVSLFPSRKLRGDLDPANVEIQRTWGLELRIRFRVELLSEEWFPPSVFRFASGHAQRRGNYSQVLLSRSTLHSVQKFLFSSLFPRKYCTLILSLKENLNYSSRFHQQRVP